MSVPHKYIRFCFFCTSCILTAIAGGCGQQDARTPEGVLARAAQALEQQDPRRLFLALDRRARAAMFSIVADRRAAAEMIRADYPEAEQKTAIAALGDAAQVTDAAELFVRRCDAACISGFSAAISAPTSQTQDRQELVVRTVRGQTLRLFRGEDGLLGIVWHTAELSDERLRANRERLQIQSNAEVYRRRRALETDR